MSVNRCRRCRLADVDDVDFGAVEGGWWWKRNKGSGGSGIKGLATDEKGMMGWCYGNLCCLITLIPIWGYQ